MTSDVGPLGGMRLITGHDVLVTRQRMGLSRNKFADLVGLTPTKIHNIEHGRAIRPEELEALAGVVSSTNGSPTPTIESAPTIESPVFLLDEDEELMLLDLVEPVSSGPHIPALEPAVAVPASSAGPGTVTSSPVTPTVQPDPLPQRSARDGSVASGPVGVAALNRDGIRRLSNSELQTFKRCRRQWWLAWYRGLRLKLQKHTGALAIGDRVHRALAAYYVPHGERPVDPREALETELTQDEERLVRDLADQDTSAALETLTNFQHDADLARAMIEGYVQWLAETGADQGYTVDAPEQQLTAKLPLRNTDETEFELTGKLDVRLRREHDDVRLWMDHKTTASFEKLVSMLVLDEQMRTYHVLEDENRTPEEPRVEGALYNMLRKVKRTERAKEPFYQRVEVRHNLHEVDRFKTRLIGEAQAITQVENQLNGGWDHQQVAYPTPGDHCRWGCDYRAICPMFDDNSRVEDFIEQHYVAVNPLDRYDEIEETM